MRITMTAPAPPVTADLGDARTISGLALPYGVAGRTSAGEVTVRAGAVRLPENLRRVKLFREHGRTQPVGYALSAESQSDGLRMVFHAAATADGDTALLEASEGVRDALSVELDNCVVTAGEITSADLIAVATVAVPAFATALIAEDTPAEVVIREPENGNEDEDEDTEKETPVEPETETAPPVTAARAPAGLVAARPRVPQTLTAAAEYIAAAFRGDRSAAAITAALADITPTTTNIAVTGPPAWLGEIWTPIYRELLWTGVVSHGTMTGMKMTGWKRVPPDPTIKPWAGEKTPIGTDANLAYAPYEITGVRHAVGVDFARELVDWGDSSVIQTWLELVIQSYADILDASVGAMVLANTGTALDAANIPAAFSTASNTLRKRGARMTFAALAGDLYDQFASIPTSEAPWWLNQAGGGSVDLAGEGGSVKGMSFFVSDDVPDGSLVAGDKRAVTLYEPAGNPIKVQSIDLPRGGIDHSVHGYSALGLNNAAGLVQVNVAAVTP